MKVRLNGLSKNDFNSHEDNTSNNILSQRDQLLIIHVVPSASGMRNGQAECTINKWHEFMQGQHINNILSQRDQLLIIHVVP